MGSVEQFGSSLKTINGIDAQLKTAFGDISKGTELSDENVVSTSFIGDDNKTQEVYGKGQATPVVFDKWFNTMLTAKHHMLPEKTKRVWVTVCDVNKCATTHGNLWQ